MLTGLQLKNKMKDLSKEFWKACQDRQYAKAKYIYLRCHTTALMAEFDTEWMAELFGRLAYIPDDPLEEKERGDGLFPAAMVEQVSNACIVHHLTTDELHLHPREPGILHGEDDCIVKVCTRRHPEGISVYDALGVRKG